MANNDFLVFGGNGAANVIDQASYSSMDARVGGFSTGIAKSAQANKVWRQSSIASAVLTQFIVDLTGQSAIDDGTTTTLLANLKQAIPAAVNVSGVNASAKINGINSPNLLFNGGGEFGNAGWTSNNFAAVASPNNDTYFANAAALPGSPLEDTSNQFPLSAGIAVTISAMVCTSGMSGGSAQFRIEGVSASGTSLGTICASNTLAPGAGWTYLTATGTTPAGCVRAIMHRYVNGSPTGATGSVGFGRMKVETGSQPSLYSQEANVSALASGMPVVGSVRNLAMYVAAASATATVTANEIIVGSALGGFKYALGGFSQTINLAMVGAGGTDTGGAPANGYVALYAIYNPVTARQALLGTDATRAVAPEVYSGTNMPSGYTASALISVVRVNGSGQFSAVRQQDRAVWVPPVGILGVTVNGGPQWHAVDCSGLLPKNAKTFHGYAYAGNDSAGILNIGLGGDSIGCGNLMSNEASTSNSAQFVNVPIITAQTVFVWYLFTGTPSSLAFSFVGTGYTF